MKNESISLDELSQRASDRRQCCQEAESLCQRQCACVFTLTTALLLQGIEVPFIDVRKHPRLREDMLQVVVRPAVARIVGIVFNVHQHVFKILQRVAFMKHIASQQAVAQHHQLLQTEPCGEEEPRE